MSTWHCPSCFLLLCWRHRDQKWLGSGRVYLASTLFISEEASIVAQDRNWDWLSLSLPSRTSFLAVASPTVSWAFPHNLQWGKYPVDLHVDSLMEAIFYLFCFFNWGSAFQMTLTSVKLTKNNNKKYNQDATILWHLSCPLPSPCSLCFQGLWG